ncbi:MAG: glycosyltransferase [Pseudomonadota bacterium]
MDAAAQSPLITVILPTFNRAHCIGDAITSVTRQKFQNWELVIIDDGSTDGTTEKIAPYLSDRRIRFVQQSHSGHAAARNHGLRISQGSLIAYLDSDCIFFPDFLAAMASEFVNDSSLDFAYGALAFEQTNSYYGDILFEPFDRAKLLTQNHIDTNVIVHRRSLFEKHGGFDTKPSRLADWDIALQYTADKPGKAVSVLAAQYRIRDKMRVSDIVPHWPNYFLVARKWYPGPVQLPRVLYVMWQYPQLSETYIETEIRCMQRWGVHVEVWHDVDVVSPYPVSVTTHRGSLEEAIRLSKADLVHVHWLSIAIEQHQSLAASGLPVTVRLHGFEVTAHTLADLLGRSWAKGIYAFPHQLKLVNSSDARIREVNSVFDTAIFSPFIQKDPKLVVRTAATLASKDLPFFFKLAELLPDHRFVLAAVTCNAREDYAASIRDLHRSMNSKVELRFDVPRDEIAELVAEAGIYVHTLQRPGLENATPVGMPISIAEAMATGAYVLAADLPEFQDYVGDAGATYRDLEHAAELIALTANWSAQEWQEAWTRSVERAFRYHADELVLRGILDDWIALTAASRFPPVSGSLSA